MSVKRYYPEAGVKLITDAASYRYDEDDLFVQYTDYAALEAANAKLLNDNTRLELEMLKLEAECARLRQELEDERQHRYDIR